MAKQGDDEKKGPNQNPDLVKKPEGSDVETGERVEKVDESLQKSILEGIRNFYTPPGGNDKEAEESERTALEKRMQDLQDMLDKKNVELEEANRTKGIANQQVKAYEILLTINQLFVRAIETKISVTQSEISKISSAIGVLKNQQGLSRAYFIKQMFGLSDNIRNLQDIAQRSEKDDSGIGARPSSGEIDEGDKQILQIGKALTDLEAKIADMITQTRKEEEDGYQEAEHMHQKVVPEMDAFEKREVILNQLHEGINLVAKQ